MSELSSLYPPGYEPFTDYSKHQQQQYQSLDLFSFHSATEDIIAPPPEFFESDIDTNLADFESQLQILTVDSNAAYSYFRSNTHPSCGPGSTFTTSANSDSPSDDFFSDAASAYYTNPSPPSNLFDIGLEMDFQRVRVSSDYGAPQSNTISLEDVSDPNSFGTLPPTPPRSPPTSLVLAKPFDKVFSQRSSFSDYGPRRESISSDYYSQIGFNSTIGHNTVSPLHISTHLPSVSPVMASRPMEEAKGDPRKKYRCPNCPRSFARAYNLKTHMATHDPNRLKPHVCPHRSCGRSFSRKHDLGRHLVSIHRDESVCSTQSSASKKSIGVENGSRGWCDTCGKGFVGRSVDCDCHDVK